ncbi:putative 4'-phosphopantetheinyl transferase [Rodentibacter pneumotropicus]|uniref:Putative 4'-phosphopantetheinyl transferase n=1 Tax=Rodentibacter pneumotropicus TaxID=758 RepID=A0A3S4VFZ6_9PAST|nr:putative 4'-phosphopantetheinyl transferase [Rodentibacter pneumotropicus]
MEDNGEKKSAVGIDIEFPKQRHFLGLMQHFAPKDEVVWFSQQLDTEEAFYRSWCLREAILKSQGVGIVKLSEVRHLPYKLKIFSDYCPPGGLFLLMSSLFIWRLLQINLKINRTFYNGMGKNLSKKYSISLFIMT